MKVLKQTKAVRYKLSYSVLYWKVFEIRRIRGQKGLSAGTSLYNLGFVFKVLFSCFSPCPASLAWDYVQAPSESRQMFLNKKETEKPIWFVLGDKRSVLFSWTFHKAQLEACRVQTNKSQGGKSLFLSLSCVMFCFNYQMSTPNNFFVHNEVVFEPICLRFSLVAIRFFYSKQVSFYRVFWFNLCINYENSFSTHNRFSDTQFYFCLRIDTLLC